MKEILKYIPDAQKKMPMSIELFGVSYCDGSYHIQRMHSHVTVIEYVYSGEGYIIIDGQPVRVGPDSIYLLPAGMDQEYYSSADDPWEKVFMNIRGNLATSAFAEFSLQKTYVFDGKGIKKCFDQIKVLLGSDLEYQELESRLCGLYFEILSQLCYANSRQEHSDAAAMKHHIDNHVSETVSNQALASMLYRSTDYCIKRFKANYGITPYEYQIQAKINTAQNLLRSSYLPIAEIAAMVGYSDPQYFSNLFKKRTGLSPRQYRNKQRNHP